MIQLNSILIKTLYARFASIYAKKFVESYHDEDFIKIWCEEWESGLRGIDINLIKPALDHCKMNFYWPPCISEFRLVCESLSGLPHLEKALQMAIRSDYSHPLIEMCVKKIGNWSLSHDSEKILREKFKVAYQDSLAELRNDPNMEFKRIEDNQSINRKINVIEGVKFGQDQTI